MITRLPGAALASLVALVLALGACTGAGSDPSPDTTSPPRGAGGSGALGEPPGPPPATSGTVAVYYVAEEQVVTDGGAHARPRLYREFRELDIGDGSTGARVRAAVVHMLTPGSALDPDFGSGWPAAATVTSVEISGTTATVDLAGAASHSVGSEAAHVAVQQLVWTATADPEVDSVRLLLDGAAVDDLWGHVGGVGEPLTRAPAAEVLALLWLISPQHDQAVPATFEVHLYGAVFEATAQLRVRQDATVVHEQTVTLGGTGFPEPFGEAKFDLTLAPGTYTLEVYEQSAVDGSEIRLDDKVITVG